MQLSNSWIDVFFSQSSVYSLSFNKNIIGKEMRIARGGTKFTLVWALVCKRRVCVCVCCMHMSVNKGGSSSWVPVLSTSASWIILSINTHTREVKMREAYKAVHLCVLTKNKKRTEANTEKPWLSTTSEFDARLSQILNPRGSSLSWRRPFISASGWYYHALN